MSQKPNLAEITKSLKFVQVIILFRNSKRLDSYSGDAGAEPGDKSRRNEQSRLLFLGHVELPGKTKRLCA